MRILDLFCGGGGAAEGYRQAFPSAAIMGVDIAQHDSYELVGRTEFVKWDALLKALEVPHG